MGTIPIRWAGRLWAAFAPGRATAVGALPAGRGWKLPAAGPRASGWIWDGSLFLPSPCTEVLEALGGNFPLFSLLSEGKSGNFSPFPFSPCSQRPRVPPCHFPSVVSQPCWHRTHPRPRFWGGFAAFWVIPSPEQWETLLNFRVCWSLPSHQRCGWFELPISSLAQAFNWSGCQRQGGIKGRQVLQEHPPLAGREPRRPLFPPSLFLVAKTRGFSTMLGFKPSCALLLLMPPKISLSSAGTGDPWAGAGATNSPALPRSQNIPLHNPCRGRHVIQPRWKLLHLPWSCQAPGTSRLSQISHGKAILL